MSGNLLINSGVALNFQSATYELARDLSPGTIHTFSMSGWHGGNDWDSNFGVYGVTDSGSEVLLGEASYSSVIELYYVRLTPNASYSYIRIKSMKTHNNWNYQINWAVLNEGMTIYSRHSEPVLRDIRRLYYGQDEVMKRYVGSDLAHLVEWQRMTRMETIPFSTSRYNDANRYIGEEVITQAGVNGWTEYVWTTEVVNGVRTGNKTSELVGQIQAPRQQQIAVGTKARNMLASRPTGVSEWAGRTIYYYPWVIQPEEGKRYKITRSGVTSENGIYKYARGERFPIIITNYPGNSVTMIIVPSSHFRAPNGNINDSLGLSVGLTYSSSNPGYTLTVEEYDMS